MTKFETLKIKQDIIQNIRFLGFEEMTPIQDMALPHALNGKDIIGQAKTGTGKTFAFAIPIVEKVRAQDKYVQAIVLTPTRELAIQVSKEFEKLTGSGVHVALSYGGASMSTQVDHLRRGAHVVVGTPGRVIDHIKRGNLRLDRVETLVLDEADRMLDMGFIDDVQWIIEKTPKQRQTMLFSATMPEEIRRLASRYMHSPEFISASSDNDEMTVALTRQFYVQVEQNRKMDAFFKILSEEKPVKALVFCKTKRWVETLYNIMLKRRYSVDRIHGDLTQPARKRAVDKLKNGNIGYLICTDVVARGIDIQDISHVFNYDLPTEPLTYVHRIGRTGRAGRDGTSVTFISHAQVRDLQLIEYRARTQIKERRIST
jgi:ATP-dependent RNA helicase DeaD